MNASTIAATALASVLREHGIAGSFAGDPVRGPRTLSLALALRSTGDLARVLALDEAVAMRAGLEHVRLARWRAVVIAEFELPRGAWRPVTLDTLPPRTPGRLALGLDTRGRSATVSLADPGTPHLLIAGASGSGKTTMMRSIMVQTIADGARLHVIDTKAELAAFYASAATVHTQPARAAAHLADIAGNLRAYAGSVVAIDELAALIHGHAAAARAIGQIASLGRSLGVHLVAGTQRVDKATLGDRLIVDNTARLVGRVVDAGASALATGRAGMGAHRLSGYGDFLLVQGDQATRFVAAQAGAALDALPVADPDTILDADPPADPLSDEWRIVGRLLAASATQRRQLSSRLVAAALGCGTDRARRLRDYAQAVLDGLADGAAAVCATNDNEVPPDD